VARRGEKWLKCVSLFAVKMLSGRSRATRLSARTLGVEKMTKPTTKILLNKGTEYEETLWAFDLGNNIYKLANSPFFSYGISYEDEIEAISKGLGQIPEFIRIKKKSGNRTIRISVDEKSDKEAVDEIILLSLHAIGCTYEGANKKYISLNIPVEVKLEKVVRLLIEQKQLWEYADPTYEEVNSKK